MDFAYPQLSDEHLPASFGPADRTPSSSSSGSTRPSAAADGTAAEARPPVSYTPPPRRTSGTAAAKKGNVVRKEIEDDNDDFARMLRLLGSDGAAKAAGDDDASSSATLSKPALALGLGPPPATSGRLPLRQTSSSSALPLSSTGRHEVTRPTSDLPTRPHSTSPTEPVASLNIFSVPVTPLSPLFKQRVAPPVASPRAQLRSSARILPPGSPSTRAPAAAVTSVASAASHTSSIHLTMFETAKDLTLEEDPFAPSGPATAGPGNIAPPGNALSSSDSSSDDDDNSSFPYAHELPTRQNHTSPYPSGNSSPLSAWHRHQTSLPQDFVFASPMSSSSGASSSAQTALDPDATLPRGTSPPPPPAPPAQGMPRRRFSRSASQPIRSNVLARPPIFNNFVPSLPPYHEAVPTPPAPAAKPTHASRQLPDGLSSTTNGFRSRAPGARTTSLTMQLAQKEALEEQNQSAFVPPIPASPPLSQKKEAAEEHQGLFSTEAAHDEEERRDFLTRPLGLLALSQALSAANDEVDTLRTMVRDTTGLVVDQAYWANLSSQAAAAAAAEAAAAHKPKPGIDELTEREIDEMSGSQAREALKILAATSTKSLAAISCVRSMHALVHSPPGKETAPPSDADVFTPENLAMLEGTVVAWGRMARMYQQAQQALTAGRLAGRERAFDRPR